MRLAISYDRRFCKQFLSAGLDPNDPSSKLKIREAGPACSINFKGAIVQSGDLLKGNFDFTIPANPINVSLEKTVFKLPGDGGSTLASVFKEIKHAHKKDLPMDTILQINNFDQIDDAASSLPKYKQGDLVQVSRRTGPNETNLGDAAL
mmetsp:Transcript_41395/g.53417  ORF Transcript_41395/g.53417 Transcript_41395/m.53417 type:complete len:149 (-) Transcript_41395:352-798(-)